MRKATWGALLLGVFALSTGSPIREELALHRILGLSLFGAYLLFSYDPPTTDPRQRRLLLAGIGASVLSFLIAFAPLPDAVIVAARFLAVVAIALPVWLVAGPARYGFVAAATVALFTAVPAVSDAGIYATSVHAYIAAASALAVAALIHRPTVFMAEKKVPRIVVASNIVTYTPEEKARALARLDKRYRDGELEEHVYLDKRQELESR
ncbi:MAG: hypothetical protein AABY18_09085 [Candidatus Thermoplasmatota archaeon]